MCKFPSVNSLILSVRLSVEVRFPEWRGQLPHQPGVSGRVFGIGCSWYDAFGQRKSQVTCWHLQPQQVRARSWPLTCRFLVESKLNCCPLGRFAVTSHSSRRTCESTFRISTLWPGSGSASASGSSFISLVHVKPRRETWGSNTWSVWRRCSRPSTLSDFTSVSRPQGTSPSLSAETTGSGGPEGKRRETERYGHVFMSRFEFAKCVTSPARHLYPNQFAQLI